MKIKETLFNNVVVKIIAKETRKGNLIVPDLGKEKSQIGEVISVGPGFKTIDGTLIETTVKVGDIVAVPKMGFQILELGNDEYLIGKETDILVILEKE